ncbi:methyltransferase domain-containing protein [Diaporthe amygdali]|uniref:methyltransferase domain-containing protein n=1 Tax=Phomopsis amygdali TaxID=1214568 RepID=UPI0022FF17BA|nr:methyltransferase domain-containing protein [Diaporthe amygdali]KAJ0123077.1 methyltransferase domain-containing protein [Diaporthe amygdali]
MASFFSSFLSAVLGHRLADINNKPTAAGAAVYSPVFLNIVYDRLVLGLYCTYVWRCPAAIIEHLYQKLLQQPESGLDPRSNNIRILDIGVGTGYFVANTDPLSEDTSVTLFDLNPACLETASARCRAAHPGVEVRTVCGDFLAPASSDIRSNSIHTLLPPTQSRFTHIFTTMLLHCLPGPPSRKAAALCSLAQHVEPKNGVLAGVTILGKGVRHSLMGRFIMFWHNALGMFDNAQDDVMEIIRPLEDVFVDVQWRVVGTILLFEARGPKL